ncbi:MAG TPA: Crp/Fnr family transcriptional regulator [Candidatus Eisenbacteria bacterium]|nr:Crp/Fnr family transcriptional regulator [Candidatus Eisenbacteria bacterium]
MRNFVPMSTYRLADQTADHSVGSVPAEDWQWAGQEAGVDFMSRLSATNRRRILEGSTRAVYRAGAIVIKPDGPPHTFVIERGLARCYWSVPDGRQATVAFLHPKELVCPTIIGDPACTFVQVVTESALTSLDPETVRDLAASETEVSAAMSAHLSMRVRAAHRLIAIRSLGSIRERVAYDLLDRASQSQLVVGRLEVRATQADIADSIGSSREVISRALTSLRAKGIVETAPGVVRILAPSLLASIVGAFVT